MSSGLWCCVDFRMDSNVSDEYTSSIFRVSQPRRTPSTIRIELHSALRTCILKTDLKFVISSNRAGYKVMGMIIKNTDISTKELETDFGTSMYILYRLALNWASSNLSSFFYQFVHCSFALFITAFLYCILMSWLHPVYKAFSCGMRH
jgi:hypothetical protein